MVVGVGVGWVWGGVFVGDVRAVKEMQDLGLGWRMEDGM